MATINNSELIQGIIDKAKIQLSIDRVPTQLAEKIVPVLVVDNNEKRISIVKAASNATTGNLDAYTTPSNKDFYLCSCTLSTESDVACDNTETVAFCTPADGVQGNFLSVLKTTLTIQSKTIILNFPHPIKCERNTVVGAYTNFSVGANVKSIAITGYTANED